MADIDDFASHALGWVAINTHPHKERLALEHLGRQQFISYCPMLRARVRHARRLDDVLRPMFPGYIFATVGASRHRWRPLLSTVGVRSIVRSGDQLSFLPRGFIEALRQREIDGAVVRPASPFRTGQKIRITGGPLDGIIAKIVDLDGRDRLVALMRILNGEVKVNLGVNDVTEATHSA